MIRAPEQARARPSSTVVLVRQTSDVPQVFLVKRHPKSSFGSAFAFPGGVVDSSDELTHDCCVGLRAERANQTLHVESSALDYYVAAIRELFEESGVLLADCALEASALRSVRASLNNQTLQWDDFVRDYKPDLRCDALHYFAHWITPVSMAKRYSTRFFLAELPQDQIAQHDDRELTDSVWMPAADALAAHNADSLELHFPTIKTLQAVAAHETVQGLIDWADGCAAAEVKAVRPLIARSGRPVISEPGNAGDSTS